MDMCTKFCNSRDQLRRRIVQRAHEINLGGSLSFQFTLRLLVVLGSVDTVLNEKRPSQWVIYRREEED